MEKGRKKNGHELKDRLSLEEEKKRKNKEGIFFLTFTNTCKKILLKQNQKKKKNPRGKRFMRKCSVRSKIIKKIYR